MFTEPVGKRLETIRLGRSYLIQITEFDCSSDLAMWRELLTKFSDECGHCKHPYAFDVVDVAIQKALLVYVDEG